MTYVPNNKFKLVFGKVESQGFKIFKKHCYILQFISAK